MSNRIYPDDPAIPCERGSYHAGETKRERIARTAMLGFLSADHLAEIPNITVARMAVEMSDHLINELNRSKQ